MTTVPASVPTAVGESLTRIEGRLKVTGVLAVLHHGNAPRLTDAGDATLLVLQDDAVPHWGWPVPLVVATTSEQARAAAEGIHVTYDEEPHDVVFSAEHAGSAPGRGASRSPRHAGRCAASSTAGRSCRPTV